MRWRRVPAVRVQPRSGTYKEWKQLIADDCGEQCVYCAIHESLYGGLDNFHVEHYRPRSNRRFRHLENVIVNLFLACAICNRFKGNDWPNDPLQNHTRIAYPDPSRCDYNALFLVEPKNFTISGSYVASAYVVYRLYLNRPQLVLERRNAAAEERIEKMHGLFDNAYRALPAADPSLQAIRNVLLEFSRSLLQIEQAFRQANGVRPYELADVRRAR